MEDGRWNILCAAGAVAFIGIDIGKVCGVRLVGHVGSAAPNL